MAGEALPPGSAIGILGGGQLGRMLALAAARLGFRSHIYCPDPFSPAFDVSAEDTVAAYEDVAALEDFARSVDVVTYEFESIEVAAVELLERRVPVRPGSRALAMSQDRLTEKTFLRGLGIATADFAAVEDRASLGKAIEQLGLPAILKARRFGYDGKGQAAISSEADIAAALDALAAAPAILEARVPFAREISIIAARALDGTIASYDIAENEHRGGILFRSTLPARADAWIARDARSVADTALAALDYVGVIGIEFFVVGEGEKAKLLVNEFAPRVHNSGHWTEDACVVSQFENHIRAIAGWPLGSTARHADVQMTNLIGADADLWAEFAADPGARLHLYGKKEARSGRKMGHVNRLRPKS
jgi:5-(carboxyamino)imidazole ribonucleotide synthase